MLWDTNLWIFRPWKILKFNLWVTHAMSEINSHAREASSESIFKPHCGKWKARNGFHFRNLRYAAKFLLTRVTNEIKGVSWLHIWQREQNICPCWRASSIQHRGIIRILNWWVQTFPVSLKWPVYMFLFCQIIYPLPLRIEMVFLWETQNGHKHRPLI